VGPRYIQVQRKQQGREGKKQKGSWSLELEKIRDGSNLVFEVLGTRVIHRRFCWTIFVF